MFSGRPLYSRDGHPVEILSIHWEENIAFAEIRYLDGHLPFDVKGRVGGTEEAPTWEHRVLNGKVVGRGGSYWNDADWVVEYGLSSEPIDHEAKGV